LRLFDRVIAGLDRLVFMGGPATPKEDELMRLMAVLLCILALPSAAEATVVMRLSRAEMTDLSDAVVHARVGAIEVIEEAPGRLVTLVALEVISSLKGIQTPGSVITVQLMGGARGDFIQRVAGTSKYSHGEELVLFLSRFRSRFVQVGIGLGRFVIEATPQGMMAREELGDVAFAAPAADGIIRLAPRPEPARLSLADLSAEVRAYSNRRAR
jgi:hypothetical protein